jgi:2-polyprenyl-3-methyl-5-hydroxy-6-metoxy-1,4-benzoquinol methylase
MVRTTKHSNIVNIKTNKQSIMFRHKEVHEQYYRDEVEKNIFHIDTLDLTEWDNDVRIYENSWQARYDYESNIISHFVNEANLKTVLEVGSGPGELSNFIRKKSSNKLDYDLVDKPHAEKMFNKLGYEGNFFVKDVSKGFDTTGLKAKYDLIICNDCLEHLLSPSLVIQEFYKLISEEGFVFISNPNWRMGHGYIYRGLFDFDNFAYMFYTHGLELKYCFESPLKTVDLPRLDSEKTMPEELRTSWNHYLVFQKRSDFTT